MTLGSVGKTCDRDYDNKYLHFERVCQHIQYTKYGWYLSPNKLLSLGFIFRLVTATITRTYTVPYTVFLNITQHVYGTPISLFTSLSLSLLFSRLINSSTISSREAIHNTSGRYTLPKYILARYIFLILRT